ncbi:molybdate transport system ATP-binding protein [Silvimonas terrae]|uniref:Molybdate transport system ATP-binding protein n=1 Tax=Silvimonas terrae TaxID=300266 RepID=A0A840RH15_9NEIS|nr:ATP-binding cassette domain-containing protein [Silvimonas terrae]MBB5192919.1 molybdate transport system ATP-binding protein [Silvimonas terrae]
MSLQIEISLALPGRILDIHTDLPKGGCLALYGPSGVGKTTLLRVLAGLQQPQRGSVLFDGKPWLDTDQRLLVPPRSRRVGFVFQDFALFPNMTVEGNLAFAQPRPDAARRAYWLALTGMTAYAQRSPRELSGGQMQRVALARALASEPQLLLLDEALSALDSRLRADLQDALADILAETHLTTVLVSHDPGEVFRLATQVAHLQPDAPTRYGTPREVLLKTNTLGRYALAGQVLLIEPAGVQARVVIAIGIETLTTLLNHDEAAALKVGQRVSVALNGASAMVSAA